MYVARVRRPLESSVTKGIAAYLALIALRLRARRPVSVLKGPSSLDKWHLEAGSPLTIEGGPRPSVVGGAGDGAKPVSVLTTGESGAYSLDATA